MRRSMDKLGGFARQMAFAALLLAIPSSLLAQTAGATLTGRVMDEQGAALPGATLTVHSAETGLTRVEATGADGSYRFPTIPAGTYDVKVELQGYKSIETKALVLNVATTRTLDLTLPVAAVAEMITVTSEVPMVKSEPSIGTVVSQSELKNLPLNGRQFANLAALAPGTSLAYNSDPTKPGQLTVAINGGIGRNVNSVIDGGDNTDDTIGGALQNYSVESVQEFNIQTQEYKAEYGRSTGGVLAVQTKTGTNDFHGSFFSYGRNDVLNSETESEKQAGSGKNDYSRYQYGFSFGGPIVKDKVHFFGTYERTQRTTNYTVNTDGAIPGADGAVTALPFRDNLASGKVTWDINPKQFLQVRFGYQKNSDKYGASPLATPTALGTVANEYWSMLAGHTTQVGAGGLNDFVFQYTKFDNTISADSKDPTLIFPNGATSGQSLNVPQATHQEKWQVKDEYSFGRDFGGKRHDFKTGLNFVFEPTLGGDFSTGVDAPQFTLKTNDVNGPVTDITQNGGNLTYSVPVNQYSFFFQDDWRASKRLTINAGLRYDIYTGLDLDQTSNPIWKTLSTQTTYNESYLQDFQGGKGGKLETDKNNFAPRLGVSYDVKGDGRSFIRAGWGLYYDFPYINATILFPTSAVQSNYGVAYNVADASGIKNADGSFYHIGQPLPPNQLPGTNVPPPNEIASPSLRTPYSRQASFGYSTQVNDWLGITADFSAVNYRDIPFRFRGNPRTGQNPDGSYQSRRFSDFGNFRIWYGKGSADYYGVNIGAKARVNSKFTMQGFYTISSAKGNVLAGADEFRLSDVNYQPDLRNARDQSCNPLDPLDNKCRGPLNTDARHRVTLSGTYVFPYDISLSGMFRFHTATPVNVYAGADLNGDGFVMDLPDSVAHVNSGRAKKFSQLDMRVGHNFVIHSTFGIEALFEIFNVFNAQNPAGFNGSLASGNVGQPSFYAGDPLQGEQRMAQWGIRVHF